MKGNRKAYRPVTTEREIKEVKDVFREDDDNRGVDDPLVMTSIRIHSSVRTSAKVYATTHGMKMQEVFEQAIRQYVDKQETVN
ncbi:hypothetical protein BREU_3580 [Bifidobacterium reuteri DSM 23975]|uniref:Uncharacterized protein n=1 Tax=Bifidobacterium reuteri DSM 23975 TaxID=1437610 RepID=A0A087CF61_9BIFI|nr:hypothetical protein [Bifidobacterium reuteri]KFI81911.1 hypothetical protein BREU_3580 [Bifidobacterium reuteri DSM 23975]